MKNFLNVLSISVVMMVGMGTMVSCEEETLGLDNNVIGGEAEGNLLSLDVIAYNDTIDTIRSDRFVLKNATLGAYNENIFGTTSSKFYAQFRPSIIGNQDFHTEPKVDSVNLVLPVFYKTTDKPLSVDTIKLSRAENPSSEIADTDTILITTKYKVDSLYGKKDLKMTLNVRDINTTLLADSKYFSKLTGNDNLISTNSKPIGTLSIGNTVETKVVKQKSETTNIYSETVGYKISLDKDYFEEKIIKNAKTGLLSDYATFIRENIKGFEFSVEENDGFILNFNPSNISLNMYYSYKNPVEKGDDKDYKERLSGVYGFDFSNQWASLAGPNVLVNEIKNNFIGTKFGDAVANPNKIEGDSRLYLNGMSGSYIGLKINQNQLEELKTNLNKGNIAILGAKLKLYIDDSYGFPKPPYITAINYYKKEGGDYISEMYQDSKFQIDAQQYFYNSYPNSVHFNPIVTGKTDYYTIDITGHLKQMLEKGVKFEDQEMRIFMGNFLINNSTSTVYSDNNPYRLDRSFNPYRVVLHGNKTEDVTKKLKLLVYYSKK